MKSQLTRARSIGIIVLTVLAIAVLVVVWNVAGKSFDKQVLSGDTAPDFALQDDAGKTVSLDKLRGQIVVLNFGTTWCDPCRQEDPELQHFYDKWKGKGVTVLKIDYRETNLVVQGYKNQNGMSLPFLMDRDGQLTTATYGVVPFPTTLIIDRAGLVRYRTEAAVTQQQLEDQIRPLLDK